MCWACEDQGCMCDCEWESSVIETTIKLKNFCALCGHYRVIYALSG